MKKIHLGNNFKIFSEVELRLILVPNGRQSWTESSHKIPVSGTFLPSVISLKNLFCLKLAKIGMMSTGITKIELTNEEIQEQTACCKK